MVGKKIGDYLNANGIKQSYLADKIGIDRPRLSNIIIHDRKVDCVLYYKICKALGLPLDYFMEDE